MAVRPIDANALLDHIKNLNTWYNDDGYIYGYDMKYPDGMFFPDDIIASIENTPTLTPPNEWVSVEERLPTDERPVLVFVGYADTMTGFITTSSYFCFDANPHWQWDGLVRDEQRTLFWMPLPAPPDRRPPEGEL